MRRSLALAVALLVCALVGASGGLGRVVRPLLLRVRRGLREQQGARDLQRHGRAGRPRRRRLQRPDLLQRHATAGADDQPDRDRRGRRRVRGRAHRPRTRDPRPVADQTNGSGWFNGDDAIVLRKGTTVLDLIGQIGFDPGTEWGTGVTSTADNTLRRKPTITAGDTERRGRVRPGRRVGRVRRPNTFDGLGAHTVTAAARRRARRRSRVLQGTARHGGGLRDGPERHGRPR